MNQRAIPDTVFSSWPLLAVVLCLGLAACGSDESGDGEPSCEAGLEYNPVSGGCEPRQGAPNGDSADAGATDSGDDEPDASGGEPDMATECIDLDGDGVCAEDDCDDEQASVAPGFPEICDTYDNDCNDELNDGIECGFYAHTQSALYFLDPFAYTADKIADTPTTLLDIDTHPDGRLFAILADDFRLAVFNETSLTFEPLPNPLGPLVTIGNANGMAIDNTGKMYITSSGTLFTADLDTGVATAIGSYAPYISSGDVVVTKGDRLLMTSSHVSPDALVRLDGETGSGSERGDIGVDSIWGLTSAYGILYGVTSNSQLVIIDDMTGAGTIIHVFDGLSFYGAASTPSR